MTHLRLSVCALAFSMAACNSTPPDITTTAAAQLQAISPADPAKYVKLRDMRNWRNPYLIVRKDGIALLDPADSVEIILKPYEVLERLAQLPPSAWPYGRVVAVLESKDDNPDDAVVVRRNRGILVGTLDQAHVLINWVATK